jgi:DNA-damage-inducible protein J
MATLNIRTDDTLKAQAELLFGELGLSLSTAVNMFLRQSVREQRVPLELALDPFYGENNMRHIRKSLAQLNAGQGVEHDIDKDGE